MNSADVEVPVLIVGGGPAGLTASLLLSRHGIPTLLVDKHATASPLPRARGVHARAMEILRVCGVEPDLRRQELDLTPGAQWQESLAGAVIREDVPGAAAAAGAPVSPCAGLSISQDIFEQVLREHARGYDLAQVRTGVELETLDPTGDRAEAVVCERASGRRGRVRARYVIAADGARSPIRRRSGVGMTGADDLGTQHMISFQADLTPWTGPRPRGIYFLTGHAAALIWTHPDHRWVLNVPATTSPDHGVEDAVATVRDALGLPDLPVKVLATTQWTAAAQTATEYIKGPIFLIGDAAHRFPPAGATGVSAAMHDAHNLAWKLAAVLNGHAGAALLDSYAHERQPVGCVTPSRPARPGRGCGIPPAGRSPGVASGSSTWVTSTGPPPSSPTAARTPTHPAPTTLPAPHRAAAHRICGSTPRLDACPPSTCSTDTSPCSPPSPASRGAPRPKSQHTDSVCPSPATSSQHPNGHTATASPAQARSWSAPTVTSPGAAAPCPPQVSHPSKSRRWPPWPPSPQVGQLAEEAALTVIGICLSTFRRYHQCPDKLIRELMICQCRWARGSAARMDGSGTFFARLSTRCARPCTSRWPRSESRLRSTRC